MEMDLTVYDPVLKANRIVFQGHRSLEKSVGAILVQFPKDNGRFSVISIIKDNDKWVMWGGPLPAHLIPDYKQCLTSLNTWLLYHAAKDRDGFYVDKTSSSITYEEF